MFPNNTIILYDKAMFMYMQLCIKNKNGMRQRHVKSQNLGYTVKH